MIFNTVIAGSGGPGETVVDAVAIGIVTSAIEDDKVILIPTDIVTDHEVVSGYTTYTLPNTSYNTSQNLCLLSMGSRLDYTAVEGTAWYRNNDGGTSTFAYNKSLWSSSLDSFDSSSSAVFSVYSIDYRDDYCPASYLVAGDSYDGMSSKSFGFYRSGSYSPQFLPPSTDARFTLQPFYYVDKHFVFQSYGYSNQFGVAEITGTPDNPSTVSVKTGLEGKSVFVAKYNGSWYFSYTGYSNGYVCSFETPNTTSWYIDRRWGDVNTLFSYIDDDVDYIYAINNSAPGFYKLDKNSTRWDNHALAQPSLMIAKAVPNGPLANQSFYIRSKDYGDYVEMFLVSNVFGYVGDTGNKVAHFRFTKSSETLERFEDVFYDLDVSDYGYDAVTNFQVNWNLGLVSITMSKREAGSQRLCIFVKNISNDLLKCYKYIAMSPGAENYSSQAVTGFVKSNEGTDELGYDILKVSTAEDPNYVWTPPVGVVLGMNVIVNEGEPA